MRAFGTDERRTRLARRRAGLRPARPPATPFQLAGGMVAACTPPIRRRCTSRPARVCVGRPGPRSTGRCTRNERFSRIIGMRRTLFVFPLELAAVVQAACTEAIAAAQRRRYAKLIEEGGIAKDGRRWLDAEPRAATLKALQERGEAFATELSYDVPQLRKKIHYGEGKTWAGSVQHDVLGPVPARRRGASGSRHPPAGRGRAASGAGRRRNRG